MQGASTARASLHGASGPFERTDSAHDLPDTAASGNPCPSSPWGTLLTHRHLLYPHKHPPHAADTPPSPKPPQARNMPPLTWVRWSTSNLQSIVCICMAAHLHDVNSLKSPIGLLTVLAYIVVTLFCIAVSCFGLVSPYMHFFCFKT